MEEPPGGNLNTLMWNTPLPGGLDHGISLGGDNLIFLIGHLPEASYMVSIIEYPAGRETHSRNSTQLSSVEFSGSQNRIPDLPKGEI
jgi:hypothetical protein